MICLVFLMIRYVIFWVGAKEELPPEVLRMDGETVRVTGQIYKREQREKGPTWYLRSEDRGYIVYSSTWSGYKIGNTITVTGTFQLFERPSNPGAFDSRSYYLNQKICGRILPESIEVNDTTIQYGKEWLARLREQWKDELLTRMGDEGAVLSGILLGDKSGLEPETKELYQKNGIAHLLAVSGLHVSFIGLMLYRLMRKAGAPFLAGALVGTLILFPYAVMTGFSVSAKRAVLMYLIRMGAEVSGRVYDLLTSLAVSAAILLGAHPRSVYDVGFLLSFGAIFAIWAGETLWIHLTGKEKKGFHGKFLAAIWPGICIQLLTFPVLLTSYFEFPLYSVLINLWVIPLMSVVMGAGLLGSLCCLILPPFATVFLWISKLVLCFYEWNCQIMLQLPAARVITGEPGWVRICCYLAFLILAYALCWKRKRKLGTGFLLVGLCCLLGPCNQHRGELEITMVDVGQGDGIFFRMPGGWTCLVDGGSTSGQDLARYTLEPFLKSRGVGTLDYVFISHGDADHISGVQEMIERGRLGVPIKTLLLPEKRLWDEGLNGLARTARKNGVRVRCIKPGMAVRDEKGAVVSCLGPSEAYQGEPGNEASMILKLEYQRFSMLFTGDLEGAGEQDFLSGAYANGIYTVLKTAHHGSDGATTDQFLEQNHADVALISAGKDNPYGHPGEKLINRLKKADMKIFCTKDTGAVTIRSDGKQMWIERFSGAGGNETG